MDITSRNRYQNTQNDALDYLKNNLCILGVKGAVIGALLGTGYAFYKQYYSSTPEWLVQLNMLQDSDFARDPVMLGGKAYLVSQQFQDVSVTNPSYELYFMPKTAMQKLITDQDVRELSKIASTFRDKVREGRYLLPPYGLSLRCDFAYECNKQAYRRLMEVNEKLKKQKKKLKRFYEYHKSHIDTPEYVEINKSLKALRQEWQEECVTFMNNLKTDEVTVTAHSFIPGAVEELHMNVGRVVGDVKKRYEDSQY